MTVARSSQSAVSERLVRPLAVVAGAALLAPTLLRPSSHGPVLCPMRSVTGVWCPTCGMTRALGWLAHGDLHESLRYHPLAPVLVIESVLVAAFLLYQRRLYQRRARARAAVQSGDRGARAAVQNGEGARRSESWSPARTAPLLRGLLVANALLALVVWVIRLKLGSYDGLG